MGRDPGSKAVSGEMRNMISGIDTMVLIYAGVVPIKDGMEIDPDLVHRSKALLHMLTRKNSTIILPSIAIAELLVPVPTTKHGIFLSTLQQFFLCVPFDVKAASIAADLFAEHSKMERSEKYTKRQILKADVLIIATAKSAGATDFYTHEPFCRRLASKVMNAHPLPTQDPDDIFLMGDIRRGDL